jgi:4-amino-4-deoxy-L-arabinose transferase-like glycosyltransferase
MLAQVDRTFWVMVAVALIVFFPGLGSTHLWDYDEGYYASAALEMYQRNEWTVPYFNGELFGHKPPWMFWMMMMGYSIFGISELGARFFSAVFACIGVYFTYRLGRLLFNARAGLIGAVVLATSLMFTVVGRSATPDSFLVSFTLIALCLFAEGVLKLGPGRQSSVLWRQGTDAKSTPLSWVRMVAVYTSLALGILTKGPIAIAFPVFIMLTTLAWLPAESTGNDNWNPGIPDSRWKRLGHLPQTWLRAIWRLRPITGLVVVILVAGPWFLLVGLRTDWEFHREFFGVHHFQRATTSMEGHRGSILYYPVSILVGMYPWTVVTGAVLVFWIRFAFRPNTIQSNATPSNSDSTNQSQFKHQFGVRLISVWAMAYLVIFSCAATKLPNYVIPAYPALALMFACAFESWLAKPHAYSPLWHRGSLIVLITVGGLIVSTVPALTWIPFGGITVFDKIGLDPDVQRQLWWLGAIGVPALLGGIIAFSLIERGKTLISFVLLGAVAVSTVVCFWNIAARQLTKLQNPQQLVREIRENLGSNGSSASVATYDFFRPTMVFYNRAPVAKCYDNQQIVSFFSEHPSGQVILDSSRMEELSKNASLAFKILHRARRFPDKGELIVVTLQNAQQQARFGTNSLR